MWVRYIAVRRVRRFERLLVGVTDASRRQVLEHRLGSERLKSLGRNATAVDPARLFHGKLEAR
jgi:hypothetical protein